MKKISGGIIAFIFSWSIKESIGQELIVPLTFNPQLIHADNESAASLRNSISLPFIDDFSYEGIIPDPDKWIDRQAFVNTTFPFNPVSIGVATFDGLDHRGKPYDSVSHSFFSIGGADTLTSQPILLSGLSVANSVGLSFFYQGGGIGDEPNSASFNAANFGISYGDSLVLEFKDTASTWHHIWSKDGVEMQKFAVDSIIYIRDPKFFHDDFQFRFRNIASLIGQYDCWHIDYVELNSGRLPDDTSLTDVAIQYTPTSILKNYQSMPWNQFQDFQSTEKADEQVIFVKNNFNVVKNTSYTMTASETVTGTPLFSSVPASQNLAELSSTPVSFPSFDIPSFPLDSVVIATSFTVSATGDNNTQNDTVTRNQIFDNYLAYDDGTPEAVYRLLGSPASLAQQYHLNTPDSLQGILIHFAHTDVDLTPNLFSIYVWKSLDPEDSLLRDEFQVAKFTDTLNGFGLYRLSRPLFISDTFYIGWQQVSLQTDMKTDIGFDENNDASQHLFYNTDGTWKSSSFQGAVMMRPVLGKAIPFGIGVPEGESDFGVKIFPNPARDVLYVKSESNNLFIRVIDYAGRTVLSTERGSSIDIRSLTEGMYLLQVTDMSSGRITIKKFVKAF